MKIALVGHGRMGREVERLAPELGHEIVARIDRGEALTEAALGGAEVAIEFTRPDAAPGNLVRLAELGVDVACGTTGWDAERARVEAAVAAAGTGLITAANFSVGVALFTRIVARAATLVDALDDYDVALFEAHHRHKADAPSGTALRLAEVLLTRVARKRDWSMELGEGPVDPSLLQVAVTRAGEIPGTHRISLEGPNDAVELTHRARDRGGFARGAIQAAEWVRGRAGAFGLDDWLDERFGLAARD
jgi:4-hydroxy-tetrahydrodipicolinate reductase